MLQIFFSFFLFYLRHFIETAPGKICLGNYMHFKNIGFSYSVEWRSVSLSSFSWYGWIKVSDRSQDRQMEQGSEVLLKHLIIKLSWNLTRFKTESSATYVKLLLPRWTHFLCHPCRFTCFILSVLCLKEKLPVSLRNSLFNAHYMLIFIP